MNKTFIEHTAIIKYASTLIVGIDMEKNGDRNFLRLNTHLKISFSCEKPVEMHR